DMYEQQTSANTSGYSGPLVHEESNVESWFRLTKSNHVSVFQRSECMSHHDSPNASRKAAETAEWAQGVATRLGSSTHLSRARVALGDMIATGRSRRDVLKWLGVGAGVAAAPGLLAACGGDSASTATPAP